MPTDHVAEAKGSNIVECESGNSEDQSRAFREAQDVVAARLRDQPEGVYDASSDSIVYPKSAEQVKAEDEMSAADRILDPGSRVLLVGQPEDSEFPDGEYQVLDGQRIINVAVDPDPPMTVDQFEKLHLPINAQKMNDHDMWMPPGNQPLYWLDGAWRSQTVYFEMLGQKEETKQPENDPVNHPSHYTAYPGIEVIQLTRWLGFNKGNAVKYIARAGLKSTDTKEQDLEKAIWYLKDELALLRGEHGVFEG